MRNLIFYVHNANKHNDPFYNGFFTMGFLLDISVSHLCESVLLNLIILYNTYHSILTSRIRLNKDGGCCGSGGGGIIIFISVMSRKN